MCLVLSVLGQAVLKHLVPTLVFVASHWYTGISVFTSKAFVPRRFTFCVAWCCKLILIHPWHIPCAVLFIYSLSLLWQDFSPLSLFVALPFVQTARVLWVWYPAHVWQKKEVENDPHRQALRAQFIDMCCFITPRIKFGNPASAVMYYKAQMGGREWCREREKKKKKRYLRVAWQRHRATQLAVSVLVFPSKGSWYSSVPVWYCVAQQQQTGVEPHSGQDWPCSPQRPVTSVVFLVFINTLAVLTCFFF